MSFLTDTRVLLGGHTSQRTNTSEGAAFEDGANSVWRKTTYPGHVQRFCHGLMRHFYGHLLEQGQVGVASTDVNRPRASETQLDGE